MQAMDLQGGVSNAEFLKTRKEAGEGGEQVQDVDEPRILDQPIGEAGLGDPLWGVWTNWL
jgi:hypothetical protein